jgi:hypothetical protein
MPGIATRRNKCGYAAALGGSFIIGLAWSRCILRKPLLAGLARTDFLPLARTAFEAVLFSSR